MSLSALLNRGNRTRQSSSSSTTTTNIQQKQKRRRRPGKLDVHVLSFGNDLETDVVPVRNARPSEQPIRDSSIVVDSARTTTTGNANRNNNTPEQQQQQSLSSHAIDAKQYNVHKEQVQSQHSFTNVPNNIHNKNSTSAVEARRAKYKARLGNSCSRSRNSSTMVQRDEDPCTKLLNFRRNIRNQKSKNPATVATMNPTHAMTHNANHNANQNNSDTVASRMARRLAQQ
jgi:hypothetical protein